MPTLSLCAIYFATVIFLICVTNGNGQLAGDCDNTAGDCYFINKNKTDCHWIYTNWTVQEEEGEYSLHLASDTLTGTIGSDWLCSTQSHHRCLRFFYKMTTNKTNTLRVYITYKNSATTKSLHNVTEAAPMWKDVKVPVTATESFKIIIAGEIKPGSNNTGISVDNIDYQTSDCDGKKATTTATVEPTDSTSPTSPSWPHSATSTTGATISGTTGATISGTTGATISGTSGGTIKTNTTEASDSPTDNLILIIGVVVAGLVICIIIVVVCCLLRRKRSRPKKPDAQYTDAESPLAAMTKSEGAKYENWNAEGESKQLLTHRDPGHEDVTSKTLDANYELVEDSSAADNDPLNTLYAKVNKPKPKGGHQDPDYTVPAPCQNVHSTGESSKEGNGTVDDTEYNALSFEAKMDVPRIEEEEAEVGRVYDRLQADDPDTYSHVQREKNTSTHHPEYSHFGVGT